MDHPATDWMSALAGRYRIEPGLGRGGMATVYLASDSRHAGQGAVEVRDAADGMIEARSPFTGDSSRALLTAQTAAPRPALTSAHQRAPRGCPVPA